MLFDLSVNDFLWCQPYKLCVYAMGTIRTVADNPDFFRSSISAGVNGCTDWASLMSSFVASVSSATVVNTMPRKM